MSDASKTTDPRTRDFEVTAVEPSDDDALDSVSVILTDVRGGRVRLHLSDDMAELLRQGIAAAIDKRQGP